MGTEVVDLAAVERVQWFVLAVYRRHRELGRSALVAVSLTETDCYEQVLLAIRHQRKDRALWERRREYAAELVRRVHGRRRTGPLHWARPSR